MLTDIFLNFFTIIVTAILGILPDGGAFPSSVGEAIGWIFAFLRSYDFILPYSTLMTVLTIGLVWELFLFVWWFVHWVLRKIPLLHIT